MKICYRNAIIAALTAVIALIVAAAGAQSVYAESAAQLEEDQMLYVGGTSISTADEGKTTKTVTVKIIVK
ncbi:MAG: hypothetical protein IKF07_05520 [Eubacterium sp.]|nr:hypothetical protein [Eubacterium sp.]